jgi:hypothetical protein
MSVASYWPENVASSFGWPIAGPAASFIGYLATKDDCLIAIDDLDNTKSVLVVLPRGRFRQLSNGGIRIFGVNYRLGDRIVLGGPLGGSDGPPNAAIHGLCAELPLERWGVISVRRAH